MQNILTYSAAGIPAQSPFSRAHGSAQISQIDLRDIAAVAADILANPDLHTGNIYELNGPESVSNAELAERISSAAGRKITYIDIPEAAQRQGMLDLGMQEWQVTAVLDLAALLPPGRRRQSDRRAPKHARQTAD